MHHTFLFDEATWDAEGFYYGEKDHPVPLRGEAKVFHENDLWFNSGRMSLKTDAGEIQVRNRYEIVPFAAGGTISSWESLNPDLGHFTGIIVIINDTMLLYGSTAENEFRVIESLRHISPDEYENRGALLQGNAKLSSWAVVLKKCRNKD